MPKDRSLIDKILPRNEDIQEIEKLLIDLKAYYENISGYYSIKDDLVKITDKRTSLSQQLQREVDHFKINTDALLEKINNKLESAEKLGAKTSKLLEEHITFSDRIGALSNLLDEKDEKDVLYYDKLLNLISSEAIEKLENKVKIIEDFSSSLTDEDDDTDSIISTTEYSYEKINNLYRNYFVRGDNESTSKQERIDTYTKKITDEYHKLINGKTEIVDDEEVKTPAYIHQIKKEKDDLSIFHEKVFGNSDKIGLEEELDERLVQLKDVEDEAKKVIGLSSDAGLAGGFAERGRKAKNNKYTSLSIFIFVLILLGCLNLWDLNTSSISFKEIKNFEGLLTKIIYNTPFVWIAIVANVNLNKYARLEEEYAHKESLAKSFERYKEQINNLDPSPESERLMLRLLTANIEAFEKNAANTMDKAKADTFFNSSKQPKKTDNNTISNEEST